MASARQRGSGGPLSSATRGACVSQERQLKPMPHRIHLNGAGCRRRFIWRWLRPLCGRLSCCASSFASIPFSARCCGPACLCCWPSSWWFTDYRVCGIWLGAIPDFAICLRIAASTLAASLAAGIAAEAGRGLCFPALHSDSRFCFVPGVVAGAHVLAKLLFERRGTGRAAAKRVAVYGAGNAGWTLVSEIQANPRLGYEVVGFFDDDPAKLGLRLHGVKVLGGRSVYGPR